MIGNDFRFKTEFRVSLFDSQDITYVHDKKVKL